MNGRACADMVSCLAPGSCAEFAPPPDIGPSVPISDHTAKNSALITDLERLSYAIEASVRLTTCREVPAVTAATRTIWPSTAA
jgi:hypothetical protein